jgi:hypothetical protein
MKLKVMNAFQGDLAPQDSPRHHNSDEIHVKVSEKVKRISDVVGDLYELHHAVKDDPEEHAAANEAMKSTVIFSPGMSSWMELRDLDYELSELFLSAEKSSQQRTGVIGAFFDVLEAVTVFAFSKAYVFMLALWSATAFSCITSPIIATLAGYSALIATDGHGGRHLALLQFLATIQWLHGFCGVEFQALKELTSPWSPNTTATASPLTQQLFAVSSALVLAFRYKDVQTQDLHRFVQQMQRLRKVCHQIACIVLISCGVFEATLATLFYLCAGIVLLVTQAYTLDIWAGVFITALVIVVFKTAIYPLPEQAFTRWTGDDDGAAENWNSWIQILGLRACPQIQVTLVQATDGSSAPEDFEEVTDCKASTMIASYLVLGAAAIQFWWRRTEIIASRTDTTDDGGRLIFEPTDDPDPVQEGKSAAVRRDAQVAVESQTEARGLWGALVQRGVFYILLFSSFWIIRMADAPRFIDVAVMSALLFYLPFHLVLAGDYKRSRNFQCCGYVRSGKQMLKLVWMIPSLVIISTVLLQYAATRDQLSCFLLYNLRDDDSKQSCPLIYSSHGSCNIQQLQSCIEDNDGCLRSRNATCMLTVKEAGLDNALDTDVWSTAVWLVSAIGNTVLAIRVHMSITLRSERKELKVDPKETSLVSKNSRKRLVWLRKLLIDGNRIVRVFFVVMAPNAVVLAVYIASQAGFSDDVNMISFGYFIFLLVLVPRPSRILQCDLPCSSRSIALWVPLLTYSSVAYLAQYTWQLQIFAQERQEQGKLDSLSGWAKLAGLSDLHLVDDAATADVDEASTSDFQQSAMQVHILVIVSVCIVRSLASAQHHTERSQDIFCGRLWTSEVERRVKLTVDNQTKHSIYVSSDPIDTDKRGGWYYVREQGFTKVIPANKKVVVDDKPTRMTLRVSINTDESRAKRARGEQVDTEEHFEWLDFTPEVGAKVVLTHHPEPVVTIVESDVNEDNIRIRLNCPSVKVKVFDGQYARLPLPPYGAWLHMSRDDVCQFGKPHFVMANFLDIYGRFFRWTALLIAAVTSSYSLSFLYLLSLAEMTVQRRTDRLAFSRAVMYLLMLFYLVVFTMALLHKFSGLCTHEWSDSCHELRVASQTLMYISQANANTRGWYDIVHGAPVDFQGFLVLFIGGNILNSDYNTRQRIQALHSHELEVARKTKKPVMSDAAWLTRAMARMFFLSDVNIHKAFATSDEEGSSDPLASRGVVRKSLFNEHLSKEIKAARGYAKLRELISTGEGDGSRALPDENQDGSHETEIQWLEEIANTIAEDYKFPGALKTIEILPHIDAASPRRLSRIHRIQVRLADEESRPYEVVLPESVTSFHIRTVVHSKHTTLKLTTRDEECELRPGKRHPKTIPFIGDKARFVITVDEGIQEGINCGEYGVTVRRGAATEVHSSDAPPVDDDEHRPADEVIMSAPCHKQKAHLRTWRERHARIIGAGLFFFENDGGGDPRASSIHDIAGCEISTGVQMFGATQGFATATKWYKLELMHKDLGGGSNLLTESERHTSLAFREKNTRDMFAGALLNLSAGRPWDANANEGEPEPEPEFEMTPRSRRSPGTMRQAAMLRRGKSATRARQLSSQALNIDDDSADVELVRWVRGACIHSTFPLRVPDICLSACLLVWLAGWLAGWLLSIYLSVAGGSGASALTKP